MAAGNAALGFVVLRRFVAGDRHLDVDQFSTGASAQRIETLMQYGDPS
jgi:hypothetical protein